MAKAIFLSILLFSIAFNCIQGFQFPNAQPGGSVGVLPAPQICSGAKRNSNLKYCDDSDPCRASGFYTCNVNELRTPCTSPTPYCMDTQAGGAASCTANIPLDTNNQPCAPPSPNFVCIQAGIVPDPTDCKKYYYCPSTFTNNIRDNPSEFFCPDGYAFDPSLSDLFPCRLTRNAPASCIKSSLNCDNPTSWGSQEKMTYPNFPASLGQIGVFCSSKPLVYRCGPNSQFLRIEFDANNNPVPVCSTDTVRCSSDGQRFVDFSKPDGYLVCVYNMANNKYEAKSFNCPDKFTYNAKQNDCVAKGFDPSLYATTASVAATYATKAAIPTSCNVGGTNVVCTFP